MKNIFLTIVLLLGVMFTSQAQTTSTNVQVDSLFIKYPFAMPHVYSDPYAKTKLMVQDYETFDRVWDYHRKQTREMIIGAGIGSIGLAGIMYAVNMPTPTRQVGNPDLDDEANKARRDRRIVGASSTAVAVIGAVVFTRSFRWHRRIKADVGLQSLRLQYNLTGNRDYFNGKKKNRKLKKIGLYPKYRQ